MEPVLIAAAVVLILAAGAELAAFRRLRVREKYLAGREKLHSAEERVIWEEKDEKELSLMRRRIEVSLLQNQINPHFLYNTLDSIRSLALMNDQQEIADMTLILSRFFRYCISRDEKLVRVSEELAHIRDYYYIQKYRFEDRFEMDVQLETEEIRDLYMPKMTIQPLVENAMLHGLEKVERTGHILLRLHLAGDDLVITVSDNGCGMDEATLRTLNEWLGTMYMKAGSSRGSHSGIALQNVNARIRIMFGEGYGLRYRSLEGEGTDAIVRMPAVNVFARARYENIMTME